MCRHVYSCEGKGVSECERMCMQTWQDIYSGGIHLFWMQIELQQSFLETLLLGNLRMLCDVVGPVYIVCVGTVYLLDWGFMRTCPIRINYTTREEGASDVQARDWDDLASSVVVLRSLHFHIFSVVNQSLLQQRVVSINSRRCTLQPRLMMQNSQD